MPAASAKNILLISFSFSGQTNSLIRYFKAALENEGHRVTSERIQPAVPLHFPTPSVAACVKMMITTFFRQRIPIKPISDACFREYDLIILAGPTWSYNPSGPVLSLLDQYGASVFKNKLVLPLISCRGYWRMHSIGLKNILQKHGAGVPNCLVFSHPNKEPWRTIGVFLKIAGKTPERAPLIGRYYKKFGHSKEQFQEAARLGSLIGRALAHDEPISHLELHTPVALP